MLRELTAEQWEDWMYFYALEPWGFDVDDMFNAQISATIARTWGAELGIQDFLFGPNLEARAETQAPPDPVEQVKRMFGHKDAPPKGPRPKG